VKPSMNGRCGAGIIRLSRSRQQASQPAPGHGFAGYLSRRTAASAAVGEPARPGAAFVAVGVELLAIALAEVAKSIASP
jgi:hypothetical protein